MTIITKSTAGKKEDVGVLPLFHAEPNAGHVSAPKRVLLSFFLNFPLFSSLFLSSTTRLLSLRYLRRHRRTYDSLTILPLYYSQASNPNGVPIIVAERVNYPCRAVFFLILVALTVLSFGIIGSSILARFYGNQHTERMRFQCRLPYRSEDLNRQALFDFGSSQDLDDDANIEVRLAKTLDWFNEMSKRMQVDEEEAGHDSDNDTDDDDDSSSEADSSAARERLFAKFFTETFDLDMGEHPDDEGVSKIDVPDFKDGRNGRFVHDFKFNQTAIVDVATRRCFLMPLDREMVLPPTSLRDMMMKLYRGEYDLDMSVVQRNMRVALPAMDDFSEVSPQIMAECDGQSKRIYRLEKFVNGVAKRAAELETDAKFSAFAGRLMQYDLHNINDVERYEEKMIEEGN